MKSLLRLTPQITLVLAVSLAACGPAATPAPPTAAPTAVPATATAAPPTAAPTATIEAVGTDIKQTLPPGDAALGAEWVASTDIDYPTCLFCHGEGEGSYAPAWLPSIINDNVGIGTWAERRYLAEDYTGNATNAREYLIESILLPSADIELSIYEISPGKSSMTGNFGQILTAQQLADIVAYLETIK